MNRVDELLKKQPFTFCIAHSGSIWGNHMAIVAEYEKLYKFDSETCLGYINNSIKKQVIECGMKKFKPADEVIGELDLNDNEREWVLSNKNKFKIVTTSFGIIYELQNSSFKSMFMSKGEKKFIK